MTSDHGVLKAIFHALSQEIGQIMSVFYTVPSGEKPPYGVIELGRLSLGNGLPSPQFQMKGEGTLSVWSAYEGITELSSLIGELVHFFKGRRLPLESGEVWLDVISVDYAAQTKGDKHPWREGRIEFQFWLQK